MKILLLLTALALSFGTYAQSVSSIPVNFGTAAWTQVLFADGDDLYLAIDSPAVYPVTDGGGYVVRYNKISGLFTQTSGIDGWVSSFAKFGGELYASGFFPGYVKKFNTLLQKWSLIPGLEPNGPVYRLTVTSDNSLKLSGEYTQISGLEIDRFANYKNGSVTQIGHPAIALPVDLVVEKDSSVYFAEGGYAPMEPVGEHLIKWDGVSDTFTTIVETGDIESIVTLYDIKIWRGDFYLCGDFLEPGGSTYLGVVHIDATGYWHEVGEANSIPYTLSVYNNWLFTASIFTDIDGVAVHSAAKLEEPGTSWEPISPTGYFYGTVVCSEVFDGKIAFAGRTYDQNLEWGIELVDTAVATGISEVTSETFLLYPNPATDVVNISVPSFLAHEPITITNSLGQVVLTPQVGKVDISMLPPDMYLVRIGNITRKFIRQ